MKRVLVIICLLGMSTAFAQVQERFKTTEKSDTSEQQTDDRQNPSTDKSTAKVQRKEEEDFWDRVLIGGGVSLSLGTYTSIYLAPSVGYMATDKLLVGLGYNYMYFKWNQAYDPNTGQYVKVDSYGNTIHGPKVFAQFFPFSSFYVGSQFEYLNHDVPYIDRFGQYYTNNEWTEVLFLEAGLNQKIGSKGFVQLGLKYNILHDYDSPYAGAFFPVIGFMF